MAAMKTVRWVLLLLLAVTPAFAAVRQQQRSDPAPRPPKSGFRAEFLRDLDEMQRKITSLAAAIPAEKYTWRPAPGVRSISEVYMHIAGGNYFLATFVGAPPPPMSDERTLSRITEKPRILEELRKSFDHVRNVALAMSDADLDKPVRMFGNETTERGAMLTALNHLHEHLGQSIAYARMNGIVPPWSGTE
jgi:uncharacterized damage-inducible protein DinB